MVLFEVKVDKFFGLYTILSGSNGNVETSGSNFHLDRDGNVKVSGEITVTNTDFSGNSWIDNFNNTYYQLLFIMLHHSHNIDWKYIRWN